MDEDERDMERDGTPTDVASTIGRNYLKLTADKILQGLAAARNNASRANRRWIWELMQNALDAPNRFRRVVIAIDLQTDALTFRHNGDAFDVHHLAGLIQQVSSKPSDGSDPDTIGKFGTGFVATHLLADVVQLSGVVWRPNDLRRRFRLTLDRSATTAEALQTSISNGLAWLRRIDSECELLLDYEAARRESDLDTEFRYLLSTPENHAAAKIGVDDLVNTLPATLVNLPRIGEVRISRPDGSWQRYSCTRTSLGDNEGSYTVAIEEGGAAAPRALHFLAYERPELRLIASVNDLASKSLLIPTNAHPRLYRGFPLIGSEKFHFPFILAGHGFFPTEQRDGLLLNGSTHEAIRNHEILQSAVDSALVFTDWLIAQGATNLHVLADTRLPDIEVEPETHGQFAARQRAWRSALLDRTLVETDAGAVRLRNARIPRSHAEANAAANTELRHLAVMFRGPHAVPREDLIGSWSTVIGPDSDAATWGTRLSLTTADLVAAVAGASTLGELKVVGSTDKHGWLNRLYTFLAAHGLATLLDSYAIVPNQRGTFQKLSTLYLERDDDRIPALVLDVLELLGEHWRVTQLDSAIKVVIPPSRERGLREASQAINLCLQDPKRASKVEASVSVLRLTTPDAKDDSYRRQLFLFARDLLHFDHDFRTVESLTNVLFGPATRILTQHVNQTIADTKTTAALSARLGGSESEARAWLARYLGLLEGNAEYKGHLDTLPIVPNRLGKLCNTKQLQAFGTTEQRLDDTLIDILKELDPSQDLRPRLLADGIQLALAPYKFDELGNALMACVEKLRGNEEMHREPLLRLISWCMQHEELRDQYLKQFKEESRTIFFKLTLAGSKSGEQIMQIMLKPDRIPELAELAELDSGDLNQVMVHARQLERESASFRSLQRIGAAMEKLFTQSLLDAGITYEIKFHGIGAWDFEITNPSNGRSFYIELKSWRINDDPHPIRLAFSQALQAGAGDRPYVLCVVGRSDDVDNTTPEDVRANLVYLKDLAPHFEQAADDIRILRELQRFSAEIRLDVPGISESKIFLAHSFIQRNGRPFDELLDDIRTALQ